MSHITASVVPKDETYRTSSSVSPEDPHDRVAMSVRIRPGNIGAFAEKTIAPDNRKVLIIDFASIV